MADFLNGPNEVRRMHRIGYSIWHISAVLNVPLETVRRWTRVAG